MRKVIIVASALTAMLAAGSASAASKMSDLQYLQAARCRGLATSEALGKLDTTGLDAMLKQESASRAPAVRSSAQKKLISAREQGDAATAAEKGRLLAERASNCAIYLGEAKTTVASR